MTKSCTLKRKVRARSWATSPIMAMRSSKTIAIKTLFKRLLQRMSKQVKKKGKTKAAKTILSCMKAIPFTSKI